MIGAGSRQRPALRARSRSVGATWLHNGRCANSELEAPSNANTTTGNVTRFRRLHAQVVMLAVDSHFEMIQLCRAVVATAAPCPAHLDRNIDVGSLVGHCALMPEGIPRGPFDASSSAP